MLTRKKREGRGQILRKPLTRATRDWAGLKAELRLLGKICEARKMFWISEHVRFRAFLTEGWEGELGSGGEEPRWGGGLAGHMLFACIVLCMELGGRSLDPTT